MYVPFHLINNKISNRDLFRRLKKAESLKECEEMLGLKEAPSPVRRTASLLRFQIVNGNVKVQKSKLKSLSEAEKRQLQEKIFEVLKDLT